MQQTSAATTWDECGDRRQVERRRKTPFFSLYQLGFRGRRQHARRGDDSTPTYFDRYDARLLVCALGVIVLSALDAAFTLRLLAAGAVEMNAVMAVLIEDDITKFVSFKLALTSLAVMFLVIHHDLRLGNWIKVRHIQYSALAVYALLIVYELVLLSIAYA